MGRHAPPPVALPDREVLVSKYRLRVTGPRPVAGFAKGEVVELELTEKALAALVEAGHVTPAPKDPRPTGREQGAGPQESPADKKKE